MQMAIFQSLVNRPGNLGGFLQGGKRHILNTKAELLPNFKSLLRAWGHWSIKEGHQNILTQAKQHTFH